MAVVVRHKKTSTVAAPSDPTKVGGPDWNDDHIVTGLAPSATVDTTNATNITTGILGVPFSITQVLGGTGTAYVPGNLIEASDNIVITPSTTDYKGRYTPEFWYNVSGLTVNWESGTLGTAYGARTAILANAFVSHPSSPTNDLQFYCGGIFTVNGYVDDNGTVGNSKGAILGIATVSYLKSTVKHWASIAGAELDVVVEAGASVDYKYGVVVSNYNSDAVQGNIDDCAYYFSSQTGSPGWRVGFAFKNSGSSPLSADGTLIKSLNSATFSNLIDVTTSTITGYLLKTTPLKITGQGAYSVTTGSLTGDVAVQDMRSGSSTQHIYSVWGRTGIDFLIGVAGAANDFITGSVSGDSSIKFGAKLFLSNFGTTAQWTFDSATGNLGIASLTANSPVATDGSKNLVSVTTAAAAASDTDTFATNQGAGMLKQSLAAIKTWIKAWITKTDVGLANVNNVAQIATVKKQVFTATGTYTPSTGMIYCQIECVGPGGGGGSAAGSTGQFYSGGGGGSGSYSRVLATAATIGASKAVTIGTGGAGGAAGSNNGANGSGATSVGAICIANAGGGGKFGSAAQTPGPGAGGTVGTGDLAAGGNPGGTGTYNSVNSTIAFASGNGGSSYFGGGGLGVFAGASVTNGNNATAYGSGGSGGAATNTTSNAAGGNGSDGVVIITEYCTQ